MAHTYKLGRRNASLFAGAEPGPRQFLPMAQQRLPRQSARSRARIKHKIMILLT
jgi:hypothetical protein